MPSSALLLAIISNRYSLAYTQIQFGSPFKPTLNAVARLIARLPRSSHISSFMTEDSHWRHLTARVQTLEFSLPIKHFCVRLHNASFILRSGLYLCILLLFVHFALCIVMTSSLLGLGQLQPQPTPPV